MFCAVLCLFKIYAWVKYGKINGIASNSFCSEGTPTKIINNTWTRQAKIYKSHNLYIKIQVFRESGIVTEKITLEMPG